MASRFVSGGAIDAASGEAIAPEALAAAAAAAATGPGAADAGSQGDRSGRAVKKQAEWEAVQRELEAERRRREEQRAKMAAGEEKSLYAILQANKGLSLTFLFPSDCSARFLCYKVDDEWKSSSGDLAFLSCLCPT